MTFGKRLFLAIGFVATSVGLFLIFHEWNEPAPSIRKDGSLLPTVAQGERPQITRSTPLNQEIAPHNTPVATKTPHLANKLIAANAFDVTTCYLNTNAQPLLGLNDIQVQQINGVIRSSLFQLATVESRKVSVQWKNPTTLSVKYLEDLTLGDICRAMENDIMTVSNKNASDEIMDALSRTPSFHDYRKGYVMTFRKSEGQFDFLFGNLIDPKQLGSDVIMASRGSAQPAGDNYASIFAIPSEDIDQYPRWSRYVEFLNVGQQNPRPK